MINAECFPWRLLAPACLAALLTAGVTGTLAASGRGRCRRSPAADGPPPPAAPAAPAAAEPAPDKAAQEAARQEEYFELFKLFADTLDQVERNYVKEVDRRQLIESAIRGMLGELDPYSDYIARDQLHRFRSSVENEFGGVGVQVAIEDGHLRVISPLAARRPIAPASWPATRSWRSTARAPKGSRSTRPCGGCRARRARRSP